jgi:hypothetical protein
MLNVEAMTLRDYFAGQALVGLLAAIKVGPPLNPDLTEKQLEPYVKRAYDFADALMKEKQKRPG